MEAPEARVGKCIRRHASLDDIAVWGVLALILMDWQRGLLVMMPVFFLSTGLRTNWRMGGEAVFLAAGALLVASNSGKLLGVYLAGKVLQWRPGEASIIGWLLQTKALIMIIFANILLDKGVITSETFTALLPMAIAGTMLTVPVVSPKPQRPKGIVNRST